MKIYNINTDTPSGLQKYYELINIDSPLFQAIEKKFDEWMSNEIKRGSEAWDQYFGDDGIYEKSGSIQMAIDMIFEVMGEEKINSINIDDPRLDYAAIFQG